MTAAADIAGLLPALVTPMKDDGSLDLPALTRLVGRMFDGGAKGVVPMGGTGEYTALSPAERRAVVQTCAAAAKGRGPVIAGVLSPGYAEARAAGVDFKEAGADALMVLTPFYAIGAQQGLVDYIRRFREDVDLPMVLYEIPARTNVSLAPESVAQLAEDGAAIGIKFSNYDVPRFARIAAMTAKTAGDRFAMLGGEEPLVACHALMGARGAVLATANLFPRLWAEVFSLAQTGDFAKAYALQLQAQDMLDAVFAEANPGPLKHAMGVIGHPVGAARAPLAPPSAATIALLERALAPLQAEWLHADRGDANA